MIPQESASPLNLISRDTAMNNTYRLLELASSRLGRFAILLIGLAVPPAALFAQGNQTLKKTKQWRLSGSNLTSMA